MPIIESSRNHNCSGRGFLGWHLGPCHSRDGFPWNRAARLEFPRSKGMIILSSVPMTSPKFNAIIIMMMSDDKLRISSDKQVKNPLNHLAEKEFSAAHACPLGICRGWCGWALGAANIGAVLCCCCYCLVPNLSPKRCQGITEGKRWRTWWSLDSRW